MPPALPVIGRVEVNARGFGFLDLQAPLPDVRSAFIPPPELTKLLAGDLASATLVPASDGKWTATELKLLERPRQRLYGEVVLKESGALLRVDREVANTDWKLDLAGQTVEAGAAAVAHIAGERAVLERVLPAGADRSLARISVRHLLREAFPEELREEVARAAALVPSATGRRDLRALPTVTVDAPSTRDMDDAISVLPAGPDGALRLFVSIADASELVRPGTALDAEARARATSVYMAGHVLPMLPEELSHDRLSLLAGEDRLCLTVELRIDAEGRITASDLYESVIRSHARLSYTEVAAFLDEGKVSARMGPVKDALPWFRAAAARLSVARSARGGVRFERDEVRFTWDEAGEVSGIESVRSTSAHELVERFMVAANEAVAGWLEARGVPALFRVHERPDADRIADLEAFAAHAGYAAGFGRTLTPLALAAFDRQIEGTALEPAVRSVLRRALGPSRYTVEPGMHFGLGAPLYLHFTSPIRRYADLLVHRAVKAYLGGRRDFDPRDAEVEARAREVNDRARRASRAERDRHRVLEARVMAQRCDDRFDARIVRVRPFGLQVQLDGMLVEGVVPADALPDGPYQPDALELRLVGKSRSYTLGEPLRLRVTSADEDTGRIEFALAAT